MPIGRKKSHREYQLSLLQYFKQENLQVPEEHLIVGTSLPNASHHGISRLSLCG
jgi:hypothetical protein